MKSCKHHTRSCKVLQGFSSREEMRSVMGGEGVMGRGSGTCGNKERLAIQLSVHRKWEGE